MTYNVGDAVAYRVAGKQVVGLVAKIGAEVEHQEKPGVMRRLLSLRGLHIHHSCWDDEVIDKLSTEMAL